MNGIVFGAGYLGTRLSSDLGYKLTTTNPLNLPNLQEFLDSEKPKIVIDTIGKTGRPNIDWCESHKEETAQSNVSAAVALGAECSKRGIFHVYIGTGCLYKGNNDGKGFAETDAPNCLGNQFYQTTKYATELILREFPSLILRIRFPIDSKPHERNLIDKLLKYPALIHVQNSMTCVSDMVFSAREMIRKKSRGVFNLVNPGTISPYEIMTMYHEIVDASYIPKLMKLSTLDKITIGKRTNCVLNTDKLKSEGISLPEIHDAVRECLIKYRGYKNIK